MNYYYCKPESGYKVIGVPDDVDINNIKNLPEPDWNIMIDKAFIRPLLRYVLENDEIIDTKNKLSEKDVEQFLLGVKKIKI
jgi:hypothetical protein